MAGNRPAPRVHARRTLPRWLTFVAFLSATLAVAELRHPTPSVLPKPFADLTLGRLVTPSADAFGRSGEVRLRVTLPGETVEYPLEVEGDPTRLSYSWVRTGSDSLVDSARALSGAQLTAPTAPAMYHLALIEHGHRRVMSDVTVAVLVPFAEKLGSTLNGYHIGTYLAEKLGGRHDAPEGFIEVGPQDVNVPVTTHFRVADFLTHDGQSTWPRYVALDPKLLDKLELVIEKVKQMRGDSAGGGRTLALDVHSGFRTPIHNLGVKRSARDSRHQYGDAADVTIDANYDGRFTTSDTRIVALAVEAVEQDHPELRGGMGVYTSRRYGTPYVHIDARGKRARWRG